MRKQIFTTYILAFLGLFLTVVIAYIFYEKETKNITALFKQDINDKVNILNRELNDKIVVLKTIRFFYLSSQYVGALEFNAFTDDMIVRHKDIKAVSWIPRVLHENRDAFEKQWQLKYPFFEITQKSKERTITRAYYKNEYYPVSYINPMLDNEEAFGFDLSSEQNRKRTLEAARDSGKISATSILTLIQEKEKKKSFLILVPVYTQPSYTLEKRRENIKGFVSGVIQMDDLIYHSFEDFRNAELGLEIIDKKNSNEIIYEYEPMEFDTLDYTKSIKKNLHIFAQRQWSVEITPTSQFYGSRRSFVPYLILVMGFSFVVVGTLYTLIILRYAIDIETKINAKSNKLKQRYLLLWLN